MTSERSSETLTSGIFTGLSTIDIVYSVEEFPKANMKVAARSQNVMVGGPATNAAIAFAHLGGKATLVTSVGSNPVAKLVHDELRKFSIQLVDLNPEFEDVPVLSAVFIDGHGNRNVVSANATRIFSRSVEVDRSLSERVGIVLVDGHYMQACQAWAKAARTQGTQVVLDGGSWKEGTEELLQSVQTAICSADFLPPDCGSRDDVFEYLRSRGVANIAITDGAKPVHFISGQSSGTLLVPPVEAVDTMGAGDIFHGAYCYFASTGHGFIESLAEAAKIASESCRYEGTREWMKHVETEPA
ncbi:MAG: PfkB family carbohydrate kinase [Terracidiphilus sp.]